MRLLRRVRADLAQGKNIEAYGLSAVALLFAVVTVVSDVISVQLRWAVVMGGVALLVYRLTVPQERLAADAVKPLDRLAFEGEPLSQLMGRAKDVRIYAPSGVNLLSAQNCQMLLNGLLAKKGGSLQVIVLDAGAPHCVELAELQLDGAEDHQVQGLREGLSSTVGRLERMGESAGVEWRLLPFNPGFSLVLIDPKTRHGRAIVEFHGVRNESIGSRMHLDLTREAHPRWFAYWVRQFDRLWEVSRPPVAGQPL